MLSLEQLWRDAPAETPVCTSTMATKNMLLAAIMDGAETVEDLKKTVPLCGGECAKSNASGRGCVESAEALLSIYVPIYKMMTEDGGCNHLAGDFAKGKPWDGCAGCTGCDDK